LKSYWTSTSDISGVEFIDIKEAKRYLVLLTTSMHKVPVFETRDYKMAEEYCNKFSTIPINAFSIVDDIELLPVQDLLFIEILLLVDGHPMNSIFKRDLLPLAIQPEALDDPLLVEDRHEVGV